MYKNLMQVNWRYHQNKLGSAWRALDPYHNLRTGAQILQDAYQINRQWHRAISRYHSPGNTAKQKRRAKRYLERVMRTVNRLKQAT